MIQNSGSGGSYFQMRNYGVQFTRWDNGNKVAQIGPQFGGNGYEGLGLGTAIDAGLYRGQSGQTAAISALQPPSYAVASLPAASGLKGSMLFASNGRNASEATGAGSGCLVYSNGTSWIAPWSGVAVTA
jgi:hypothetical protein